MFFLNRKDESNLPTTGPDAYPLSPDDPLVEAHTQLSDLFTQYMADGGQWYQSTFRKEGFGSDVLKLNPLQKRDMLRASVQRLDHLRRQSKAIPKDQRHTGNPRYHCISAIDTLIQFKLHQALLRTRMSLDETDLLYLWNRTDLRQVVIKQVQWYYMDHPRQGKLYDLLNVTYATLKATKIISRLFDPWIDQRNNKLKEQLQAFVHPETVQKKNPEKQVILPKKGNAWSDDALAHFNQQDQQKRPIWEELFTLAANARSTQPSKAHMKKVHALVDQLDHKDEFFTPLLRWLNLMGAKGKHRHHIDWVYEIQETTLPDGSVIAQEVRADDPYDSTILLPANAQMLKGLVFCCYGQTQAHIVEAVGHVAKQSYHKIKGYGARSTLTGNAALLTLAGMPCKESVTQLMQLQRVLKKPSQKKQLQKALDQAAKYAGVSVDTLQETAIPTLGLNADGQIRQCIGVHTAHVSIPTTTNTQLVWIKPDGKTQKAIPKAVKDNHPAEWADLKKRITQIKKILPTQRDRIEQFYLLQRNLKPHDWQTHYLDHPLVGQIARRLIWQIGSGSNAVTMCYCDGQLIDAQDKPIKLNDDDMITLWHPINSSTDQIMAWRDWLERHQISQPFKQAHREVYLLTDAELSTEIYSNRFAAHILKQHQFASLCDARNWKYSLMGAFDSHNIPTVQIPAYNLRCEYWVQSVLEEEHLSEMGICLYISTDQVRFYQTEADQPINLIDVPPIVLSEMMRDVDLFVGVASVGNDPAWLDGGVHGHQIDYWHSYSFGELSNTAQTRRQILERLIPRLKIASQCSITDRFLIVKGSLRTYKIHFGSGNILMEPDDQYLCIVPGQHDRGKAGDTVFLPFEGDNMLAIILSKAFMLVEDSKITDKTITLQIKAK